MSDAAYDLVGPALPQALRLARYQASARLLESVDEMDSENDVISRTPSPEEVRLLESNAKIMSALEGLFSWCEKDRTSWSSKLTRAESTRFQRAVYRIWLMSVIFGPRRFTSKIGSADGAVNRKADLIKSWEDQKTFLERFSSQDLVQISLLADFFTSTIAGWVERAEGSYLYTRYEYFCEGLYLFAGPHVILRCYEDETSAYFPTQYLYEDGPHTEFLMHSISEVIQERQLPRHVDPLGIILDDINGRHDKCHHCGEEDDRYPRLPSYWNETCWKDLKGRLTHEELIAGNLRFNLAEKSLVEALNGDWSRLLHDMFSNCKHGEYTRWSTEDWACSTCWTDLFHDTLWRWRLKEKRLAGESIYMDCRYGYDCKKQCHEGGLAHAKRYNHLCEPAEESSDESEMEDGDASIEIKVIDWEGQDIPVVMAKSSRMYEVQEVVASELGYGPENFWFLDGNGTRLSSGVTAAELGVKDGDTIYAKLKEDD